MHVFGIQRGNTVVEDLDVETPRPEGSEVLLRVLRSGVCHSDTHMREGGYDLGVRGKLLIADRGAKYPLVMGHEVVGVVEAVGSEVTTVSPGDVRLVFPWIGCGVCAECLRGEDNRCSSGRAIGVAQWGGYATHIVVPHDRYLVPIGELDPAWAATLSCSGLTAYSAVNKVLPLDPDAAVVVIGAGGVGLNAISVLAAKGHRNICAVDVSAPNLAAARDLGASSTVVSGTDATSAAIIEACGGQPDAVIDFVNNGRTVDLAFDVVRKGGRLVQVGLFGGDLVLPTVMIPLKMLTIQGSYVGNVQELREVVALAQQGGLPRIPLIEEPLSAQSVADSLDRLVGGGVAGRIVMAASD